MEDNYKILFRIPFTMLFLVFHTKLYLFDVFRKYFDEGTGKYYFDYCRRLDD